MNLISNIHSDIVKNPLLKKNGFWFLTYSYVFSILPSLYEFSSKSSREMLSWFDSGQLSPGRSLCNEFSHFIHCIVHMMWGNSLIISLKITLKSDVSAAVQTASEQLLKDHGHEVEVSIILLKKKSLWMVLTLFTRLFIAHNDFTRFFFKIFEIRMLFCAKPSGKLSHLTPSLGSTLVVLSCWKTILMDYRPLVA